MSATGKILPDQRFTAGRPCPKCGSHGGARRGQGIRCTGFLSEDGAIAFCSRVESEKSVSTDAGPVWLHRLEDRIEPPRRSKPPKGYRTPQEAARGLGRNLGRLAGSWSYTDAEGRPCLVVHRFEDDQGAKTYRPVHRNGSDLWCVGALPGRWPLYRLTEVIESDQVFICEGEKAADSVRGLGLVGTTPPHGAQSPHKADWSALAGKDITILPDNDEPGRAFAEKVAGLLSTLDPRPMVRVVELPGLDEKEDVVEWIERGGTRAELLRLIESAPLVELPEPSVIADGKEDERPEIVVSTEEHIVIDQCVSAIEDDPTVYQRGNILVRVCRETIKGRGFRRPPNAPRIASIPPVRLREILTRNARVVKTRKDRNGGFSTVPTHPPEWAISGVMARGEWAGVRHLEGVIEAPTLRPDGSVIDRPGWDEPTGFLYEPNGAFPPIPDNPSREDAVAAAGRILEIVADFPFAGPEHKAAWLASLLTALGRGAIDGPVPLFLFDANAPGSGKSLLCHVVSLIESGRMMACADMPDQEAEMSKTLLSIALAGDRFVLFDNVGTGFSIGGASLDRALTAPTVKGRILGRSEMTSDLPWNAIVFVSGNNVGLRGDAMRRVIPCRLECEEERPEERSGFRIPDLAKYVLEHRGTLVADALTVLRAHAVAGWPGAGLTPMDYTAWCRVVRDAVHWVTGLDPAGPRAEARAADVETQSTAALVEGWGRLCKASGKPEGMTAKEALDALESHQGQHAELFELLCGWSRDGGLPSTRAIGNRLNKIRGRFTPNGALEFAISAGNRRWYVKSTPRKAVSGGSGDSGDSFYSLRAENCADSCHRSYIRNTSLGAGEGEKSHQSHQSHQEGGEWLDPTGLDFTDPDDIAEQAARFAERNGEI